MTENKISIKNNKFEIIRFEAYGWVKNICNYDKDIFKLEKTCLISGFEGGSCKTIYKFEIITNPNSKSSFKSNIEFIEEYNSEKKYYTYYNYDSNLPHLVVKSK